MDLPEADTLVDEQIAYYRARAPEYDDWWLRVGRYEPEGEFGRRWDAGKATLAQAAADLGPTGDVLEIAAGTGNLTVELVKGARHVTAIDASAEALAIAETKLGERAAMVEFSTADVFDWDPPRRFDLVAFGFWLSHVPRGRMAQFWGVVDRALRPGGRAFFVDNAVPVEQAAAATTTPWSRTWLDAGVSERTLADGRRFRIVKRLWSPPELEAELASLGWTASVHEVEGLFVHGTAVRTAEGTAS